MAVTCGGGHDTALRKDSHDLLGIGIPVACADIAPALLVKDVGILLPGNQEAGHIDGLGRGSIPVVKVQIINGLNQMVIVPVPVIDDLLFLHRVDRVDAQLSIGIVAPGVDLAVTANGYKMAFAGRHIDNIREKTGLLFNELGGRIISIGPDILYLLGDQIGLLPIQEGTAAIGSHTPGIDVAIGPQGNAAMLAGRHHGYGKLGPFTVGVVAQNMDQNGSNDVALSVHHHHNGGARLLIPGIGQFSAFNEDAVAHNGPLGNAVITEDHGISIQGSVCLPIIPMPQGEAVLMDLPQASLHLLVIVEGDLAIGGLGTTLAHVVDIVYRGTRISGGKYRPVGDGLFGAHDPGQTAIQYGGSRTHRAQTQAAVGIGTKAQDLSVAGHDKAPVAARSHQRRTGHHAVIAFGGLALHDLGIETHAAWLSHHIVAQLPMLVVAHSIDFIPLADQRMTFSAVDPGHTCHGIAAVYRIVYPHRHQRIVCRTVAQLALIIGSPSVGTGGIGAILLLVSDGQGMVPSGGNVYSHRQGTISRLFRYTELTGSHPYRYEAGVLPFIIGLPGIGLSLVAQLTPVVVAPGPNRVILQKGQGEPVARGDFHHVLQGAHALAVLDLHHFGLDQGIILTQLSKVVIACGVDLGDHFAVLFLFRQKQGMIRPRGDRYHALEITSINTGGLHLHHIGLSVLVIAVGIDLPGVTAVYTQPDLELPLVGRQFGIIRIVIDLFDMNGLVPVGRIVPVDHTAVGIVIGPRLSALAQERIRGGNIPGKAALQAGPLPGPGHVVFLGPHDAVNLA